MKVNDSQYVHSTTLTLDISEVFFLLKRCTLEPVEKRWYFSDVIIIIYNINQTHHPPSDFFFYHLSVLLSILVSSSSFSPSHTPAVYPSFLFPRLSRCHSALCLFPVSLCAQQSVKYCNPELRWSRPARRWNFLFSDGLLSAVQVPRHPFVTLCLRFWCLLRCTEFKYRPNCFSHHHLNLVFDQIGKKTL